MKTVGPVPLDQREWNPRVAKEYKQAQAYIRYLAALLNRNRN